MLKYSRKGTGRKVVFLHGFLESSLMWGNLELHNYFDCLYIDLPGHGESLSDIEYCSSIDTMAEEVKKVILYMQWEHFACVGHSMGGYVGLELAQKMNVKQLVLFHSNFWQDSLQKQKERERVAELVHLKSQSFIREAFTGLFISPRKNMNQVKSQLCQALKTPILAIASSSIAMRDRKDFTSWVKFNQHNIIFIQGEKDPVIPLDLALEKSVALHHFYVLENTGHMGHIESPEAVIALLDQRIMG